jgi:hypothetical protein
VDGVCPRPHPKPSHRHPSPLALCVSHALAATSR